MIAGDDRGGRGCEESQCQEGGLLTCCSQQQESAESHNSEDSAERLAKLVAWSRHAAAAGIQVLNSFAFCKDGAHSAVVVTVAVRFNLREDLAGTVEVGVVACLWASGICGKRAFAGR